MWTITAAHYTSWCIAETHLNAESQWYLPLKWNDMTGPVPPLNWKETMLVKSYIPSGMLPLTGVKHHCLMYTHAPSTFPSIIPLSKPPSHAHSPQAPCCPSLFIEYIFYSATFFHLSWQLQLLWGWCAHRAAERRGPSYFHCTHHAPVNEGHLGWNELTGNDLDRTPLPLVLLFILFKKAW